MTIKLAIIGSRAYTNKDRIQRIIERYIKQYSGNLIIISGGCPRGADFLAKQISHEMGLKYEEFPPVHAKFNQYCVLPPENYNKPYNVKNFFERNTQIAGYCDHLLTFTIRNVKANGTMDTVRKAQKLNKIVFVYEDSI